MSLQFLADGLLIGAMIGLGAIGVTLTYAILRFANFAHGEFVAWGAYTTLALVGVIGAAIMVIEHVLSPDAVDRSLQPAA